MRRLALLLTGGALWLILAAIPALADGGPHVMTANNGSLGINADGCAGCHRAHTAQGPFLIRAENENALCLSCHGAAVAGSTVDVVTGIQYRLTADFRDGSASGEPPVWSGTELGATRAGGFVLARIGEPARVATSEGGGLRSRVGVAGDPSVITSAHLDLSSTDGFVAQDIAWGNGQAGSGVGPAVELGCVSCHNPHGNGQYRILRPIPHLDGIVEADDVTYDILYSDAATNRVYMISTPPFLVGDSVTIAGHTSAEVNGTFTISAVASTYFTLTGLDVLTNGFDGTMKREAGTGVTVQDPTLPADGDTRNYTVIQKPGTSGVEATYLLYASQLIAANRPLMDVIGILSSDALTDVITTASDHGFTIGDTVTVSEHDGLAYANVVGVVDATGFSANTFMLTGVDVTTDGDKLGVVTRYYTVDGYDPSVGDYWHRAVQWYYPSTAAPASLLPTGVNDAPNGRTTFNDQITAWCTSCHTRYYAYQEPIASADIVSSAADDTITTAKPHGFTVGLDVVILDHTGSTPSLVGLCDVASTPTPETFTCTGVDITVGGTGGTATSTTWGAAYANPRPGEDVYTYQHRTRGQGSNRACTTCHVAHGSNAVMDGPFSSTVNYPDGTISDSSRLLKIDNRGTCQACHDPTETIPEGTWVGLPVTLVPPTPAP